MRKFMINVNGKSYEVEVEEIGGVAQSVPMQSTSVQSAPVAPSKSAAPSSTPAAPKVAPAAAPAGATKVESPMPGTIVSVAVSAGQSVKSGDILCVLEAMKMENEILAPRDGKVAGVYTSKGASVNTGDVLIAID